MARLTILGLAVALAIIGLIFVVEGATATGFCNPGGNGCTSANYTLGYAGIVILVVSAGIAVASLSSSWSRCCRP